MASLIDSGFLVAVISANDRMHRPCAEVLELELTPFLLSVILTEVAYLTIRDAGYPAFIRLMRAIGRKELPVVFPAIADFARAADIMEKYVDSRVDFVDCMIVAMAERLNISRILTVDQRDFRMFRPKHTAAFEILP